MHRNHAGRGDVNVVVHALLGVIVVAITAVSVGYLVPELFDRHSSAADLAAAGVAVGTLAFTYIAGRYVWRSFRTTVSGEDE